MNYFNFFLFHYYEQFGRKLNAKVFCYFLIEQTLFFFIIEGHKHGWRFSVSGEDKSENDNEEDEEENDSKSNESGADENSKLEANHTELLTTKPSSESDSSSEQESEHDEETSCEEEEEGACSDVKRYFLIWNFTKFRFLQVFRVKTSEKRMMI